MTLPVFGQGQAKSAEQEDVTHIWDVAAKDRCVSLLSGALSAALCVHAVTQPCLRALPKEELQYVSSQQHPCAAVKQIWDVQAPARETKK